MKLLGIGFVAKAFGPQVNSAVRTLMLDGSVANRELTRVAPVTGVATNSGRRRGAGVGAAEALGPKADLDRVRAVAQISASIQNALSISPPITLGSLTRLRGKMHRAYGVGVAAIVSFSL